MGREIIKVGRVITRLKCRNIRAWHMVAFLVALFFLATLTPLGEAYQKTGGLALEVSGRLLVESGITFIVFNIIIIPLGRLAWVRRTCQNVTRQFQAARALPFLATVSLAFLSLCIWRSYEVYRFCPTLIDSVAQYIHAKMFAAGEVSLPSHPLASYFNLEHFINNGRFYSQYPPGHTLLLAIGQLMHLPWLINPLLGATFCIALYFLALEMFGQTVAKLSALLALASPFLHAISSEYDNHATALLCVTLCVLWWLKSVRHHHWGYALLAGSTAGYGLITRPYTLLACLLPFAIWGLYKTMQHPRRLLTCLLPAAIGCSLFIALQFVYNYATTGNPLLYGYIFLYGPGHNPGFHAIPTHFVAELGTRVHTLGTGLDKAFNDATGLQVFLFDWPMPSLLFVPIACLFSSRRKRAFVYLSIASCMGLWLADLSYFYGDWCFGPRYLYETSGFLIMLTAYGLTRVPLICRRIHGLRQNYQTLCHRLMLLILGCIIWSACCHEFTITNCLYCWAPRPVVPVLQAKQLHNALVFVDASKHDFQELAAYYYPTRDSNDVIIAPENDDAALMRYYPARNVYRWSYHDYPVNHAVGEKPMKPPTENLMLLRPAFYEPPEETFRK